MPAAFRSDFQQTSKSQYASLKKPTPWSMKTADLFTLYVPSQADATLNFLTCSICSSYMKKPTTLPCGHTFCYQCLENLQHLRSGSLPVNFKFSTSLSDTTLISITCKKCFRTHRIHSLQDLAEDQSMCLLLNSLICERCDQLTIPNRLDTCYQCYKILCQNCHESHMLEHRDDEDLISLSNSTAVQSERNGSKSEIKSTSVSTSPKTNGKGILNESFGFDQQSEPNTAISKKAEAADDNNSNSKQRSTNIIRRIFTGSTTSRQLTSLDSIRSLDQKSRRANKKIRVFNGKKKFSVSLDQQNPSDENPVSIVLPITPVSQFRNLFHQYKTADENMKSFKKRRSELDRAVNKLIEVFTLRMSQNLNETVRHWSSFRQSCLDEIQSKENRFQILNFIWKTCYSVKESRQNIESLLEKNYEIRFSYEKMLICLSTLEKRPSMSSINNLFQREEKCTIPHLRRQIESMISNYLDELSAISERCQLCETRFDNWKNSNSIDLDSICREMKEIIGSAYPKLIELISNDFISQLPQVDNLIDTMLKNMEKRFRSTNDLSSQQRTSF